MTNKENHIMKKYYDETIGGYVSSQDESDAILESYIVSQMTKQERLDYETEKKLAKAWRDKYGF